MRQYLSLICFAIGIWAFSMLLTGCSSSFTPCPDYLRAIENRPYIPGKYTCLHKSRDYVQYLNEYGYDARMVIGQVRGYKVPHAWVEVIHEGKTYWIDPTWGYGCWKASQWSDRKTFR